MLLFPLLLRGVHLSLNILFGNLDDMPERVREIWDFWIVGRGLHASIIPHGASLYRRVIRRVIMSAPSIDSFYCSTLISLAQWSKAHTAALLDLTRELAALRDTVKALDPTFSDVLRQKREDRKKEISEVFPQSLQPQELHDELIQSLKELQRKLS